MKVSIVTGESEGYGDENHRMGKAIRGYDSADTHGADRSLCASGVC
jgi:hypothetical protein